jgi:transcriptional regulator of acetoin/glycerol metabolism
MALIRPDLGFLREFEHTAGRVEMTADAMDALLRYECPGNVREQRATFVCENGTIRREDLSLELRPPAQVDTTDLDVIERQTIERVLRETNGNKAKASRRLGISRMQLCIRLRKYGLETPPTTPD